MRPGWRRTAGLAFLLALFVGSYLLAKSGPGALARACPFGQDVMRPDRSVCELTFAGLWISLGMAMAAAGAAVAVGLVFAVAASLLPRGAAEAAMRIPDAIFSLPDLLLIMVLEFAGQQLQDFHPALRISPVALMILALAAVGWAAPARILFDSLRSLWRQDFVTAARALGAGRGHILRFHLWPFLKGSVATLFLARIPAAILAESTVSFLGIAQIEPMTLGRYLGTSYASILYPGGLRIVGPAWVLLVLVVTAASQAADRSG